MANDDQAQAAFDNFVQLWTTGTTAGRRAPVLRRPDEVRLDYENVTFPSMDGIPLEGWFIPADSDKLVIHNHFLPGNRYGYPGHLPEFGGLGGFEVTRVPGTARRRLQHPRLRHPQPRLERAGQWWNRQHRPARIPRRDRLPALRRLASGHHEHDEGLAIGVSGR